MDSMDFLTFPRQCRVVAVAHGARASRHARQPGDPRQPGGSCQSAAREVEGRQGRRWDGYGGVITINMAFMTLISPLITINIYEPWLMSYWLVLWNIGLVWGNDG